MGDLAIITGQKPALRRAKKSIAQFRVRENNAIGCLVTLRGNRMYEFFDRLVTLALPAHPRLPRPAGGVGGRPRQLQSGAAGTDGISGN